MLYGALACASHKATRKPAQLRLLFDYEVSRGVALLVDTISCYVYTNNDSMSDLDGIEGGQALQPPPRLYERLAQLSGYTWDQTIQPYHSVREDEIRCQL